jgi:signal transduction histidine kinase
LFKTIPSCGGENDSHSPEYNQFNRSIVLTYSDLYTKESPIYELTVYPNHKFFESYQTNNPLVASVVVTFIIIVTTLLSFAVYDYYVRREFQSKQLLLEQKRQFVRYISHEVRTPLNAACMGLHLIQTEIAKSLGYDDPRSLLEYDVVTMNNCACEGDDNDGNHVASSEEEEKKSWFRLAHDIENNARGSVDILSDLLNYDKIQRGTSTSSSLDT